MRIVLAVAFALSLAQANAEELPHLFVEPAEVHALSILPNPPGPESARSQLELTELHAIETARRKDQAARAAADGKNETIFLFRSVLGDGFTAEKLPLVAALGKMMNEEEEANTRVAKTSFNRERPYNLDKTLHPVCPTKVKNDSYPSGHATDAYLQALTLIDMVPEKKEAILARAADFAHNRLICGVHYPSDLEVGKLFAYTLHAMIFEKPDYRAQMALARVELRQSLGLK